MSALELLDRLAQQGLLSEKVAGKVRKQLDASSKPISANRLAKQLVKKGLITAEQAKLALQAAPPAPASAKDDDLGLLDDELEAPSPPKKVEPTTDVELVDEAEEAIDEVESLDDEHAAAWDDAGFGGGGFEASGDASDAASFDEVASAGTGRAVPRKRGGIGGLIDAVRPGRPKKMSANRWDSPLMLAGSGALMILILAGLALYFFLSRGTGDDAFAAALENYRQQSYGQAMSQFQAFIADYPDHPKVSQAKVRIGMAQIWNLVERGQWEDALETERVELPKIEGEEAFSEAREELASLLPEIMEGFADLALAAEDIPDSERFLGLANTTYEDVNNPSYLPTSVRRGQQPRIEQILAKLNSVERRINRDRELEKVVGEIRVAAGEGRIADAYGLRKQLLTTYQSLETDPRLNEVVLEITETERAAVQPWQDPPAPLSEDVPALSEFRITLATKRGSAIESLQDQVVFAKANGSVYGVRASDGTVLWRRFVGFAATTNPTDLSETGTNDVVLVDESRRELVRLAGTTGEVVWRLPCPGVPFQPQFDRGTLWVACNADERGVTFAVDPASGAINGGVMLPIPVSGPPAFDEPNQMVVQPGGHSTVYMMSAQDWTCQGVSYLGHELDTVSVPPLVTNGLILIAENPGVDFALLHFLVPDQENVGKLKPLADAMRLEGRVTLPMSAFGRRVLFTTDRGRMQVLEIDLNQPDSPIRVAAESVATVPAGTVSHTLLNEGRVWVGDNQLTGYELQTSRGQFVRKWLTNKGDHFVGPLVFRGGTLFHLRQRSGKAGITFSAAYVGGNLAGFREGESIWEIDLGTPPAGEPSINRAAQQILSVTADGVLFAVGKDQIREGLNQAPAAELIAPELGILTASTQTDSGISVYSGKGSKQVAVLQQNEAQVSLRPVKLDLGDEAIQVAPVAMGDDLLVPTQSGAVHLCDPTTGKAAGAPFLPAMSSGASVDWLKPFVLSQESAVLGDHRGNLYHVIKNANPQPHLAAERQQQSDAAFVAPVVVVGETVLTIVRGGSGDVVRRFQLGDLQMRDQTELTGRVIWGPYPVGPIALAMTDQLQLVGVDETNVLFTSEPWSSSAIGRPVEHAGRVLLATIDGTVVAVNTENGQPLQRIDLGEPLGSGPIPFAGDRFIVSGGDGTLHIVTLSQ